MSAGTISETERLRLSLARRAQSLAHREARAELVVGGALLAAAVTLAALAPQGGALVPLNVVLLVACVACAAIATQVRFEIAGGITVPIQVVFVPMLFAVPARFAPLLMMAAWGLGMLPQVLSGRLAPSRLLTAPGNSWFAFGPALVFVLAGAPRPGGDAAVLAVALAAQFACDFLSNVARERLRQGPGARELAGEVARIYLMDLALTPLGLALAYATLDQHWAVLALVPLFGVMWIFSRERKVRMEQLVELNDAYRGTAMVLGNVVEADDAYTGEHSRGVVSLAIELARALRLDEDRVRNVEFGALLHDVGKIAVPNEIINKPGRLDEQEWAIIKTHTIEGQRMLDTVGGFMREVGRIVRSSHERWDGGGYPDGLRGEQIPLEARIVSASDAFNAMTTTRSYRRAMASEAALAEMRAGSGTQFDPAVVDALFATVASEAADAAPALPDEASLPVAAARPRGGVDLRLGLAQP